MLTLILAVSLGYSGYLESLEPPYFEQHVELICIAEISSEAFWRSRQTVYFFDYVQGFWKCLDERTYSEMRLEPVEVNGEHVGWRLGWLDYGGWLDARCYRVVYAPVLVKSVMTKDPSGELWKHQGKTGLRQPPPRAEIPELPEMFSEAMASLLANL